MLDAYWTIFRVGNEVTVYDEVKDRPIKRYCKKFDTIEEADAYIEKFLKEWTPKIAILDRLGDL